MEFGWRSDQLKFRQELRSFVDEVVPPERTNDTRVISTEEAVAFSSDFVRALAARGWLAPHWPVEHGGLDDTWRHIILGEELWSRGEPRGPQYMNVNWVAPLLLAAGSDEQREYHLARIREGDVHWCQGFSEPLAGSDLASLRTSARRDGDEYVIDGQKIWTSYAHVADFCFLLARTDPESSGRYGISIFIVPMDAAGIEVREIPALAGSHQFHEVFFDGVRIPESARIGEENRGWELIRTGLAFERVGAPRYASAEVELEGLVRWTDDHGRESEEVRRVLGRARTACESARVLTYKAMDQRAKGMRVDSGAAYVARAAMVRAERAVADAARQVMGPDGLVADSIRDRQLHTALVAGIATGTYEIQLNLIARLSLGLPSD
jgi:alkylation response protein AidB-like acyl-CoA dehydrogenase